jgi:hypothetical protein
MRIFGIVCFLFLTTGSAFAQYEKLIDSLVNEVCISLEKIEHIHDSSRLLTALKIHADSFDKKLPKGSPEIGMTIMLRLVRNCREFYDMVMKYSPPAPYNKRFTTKPELKLKNRESQNILRQENLFYLQQDGDTVRLTVTKNMWLENFKDGTYSKLQLTWKSASEFEIKFIESTNPLRKCYSRAGEIFRYSVVDRVADGFIVCAEMFKDSRYETFKVFTK